MLTRTRIATWLVVLFAAASGSGVAAQPAARQRVSLDAGWRFALGNAADVSRDFEFGAEESFAKITSFRGAVVPGFDDSKWRPIDLPHDWLPELPFAQEPSSEQLNSHGYKPAGRVFPATSIGWYRKHFTVTPEDAAAKRFSIEFDGAFRDCRVWLNQVLLGRHEGGYSPFAYDATDVVKPGDNVLVVRVDATLTEGWFYEGAGIYRHVWLVVTDPVHVPRWGVSVVPEVTGAAARTRIATEIANDSRVDSRVAVESLIVDPAGRTVARVVGPPVVVRGRSGTAARQVVDVARPELWTIERPALYTLVTSLRVGSRLVDRVETRFGIRTIRFDANRGFFLNGTRVQINGFCNHQDHAGVGAALPDRLQRYRLERMKAMGANAYRTSHNPPTPELLDAADELGVLVMDETRLFSSSDFSLDQLRDLVRRDRNHPSVILWSIGNEEPEQATPLGNRVARTMMRAVKELDTTRPVTYASNSGAYAGVNELMDVRGFNYHMEDVDAYHRAHPEQPLIGSEIASTLCTRGEYAVDKVRGYMSAYDTGKPPWGELAEEWMQFYMARPWLAGAFVWTGFDYRGEPTPYRWPCISSHFGVLDTCGFAKDLFWYYKSWWTSEPVLHLLPHWNWHGREGQPIDVWAFTNADEVRLSLNGRDLGTRRVPRYGHAEWQVPYEAGRLEAVGLRDGREIARQLVETTGGPARVTLVAEVNRAERAPRLQQVAPESRAVTIVTVSAVDASDRQVPTASDEIAFEVSGPARFLGVGNGDPSSHEQDQFVEPGAKPHRRLFNGLAQVLLEATGGSGEILLRATAPGLQPATLVIRK